MAPNISGLPSPPVFAAVGVMGLVVLWFSVRRFVQWIQTPPKRPPEMNGALPAKTEVRPRLGLSAALAIAVILTVIGIAGAAVTGPWPAQAFNGAVRPIGLILDVVGVFLVAGSVERVTSDDDGNTVFWSQEEWEFPGIYLVVTGFVFLIATSFEAFQISGRPPAVSVTAEPLLDWISGTGPLLVASATGSAAWIAWEAHKRENRRISQDIAATDAQISALAYVVYRRLIAWTVVQTGDLATDGLVELARRFVADEAPEVDQRMERMLALAPDASSDTEEAVRKATLAYFTARDNLEVLAGRAPPGPPAPREPGPDVPDGVTYLGFWERSVEHIGDAVDVLYDTVDEDLRDAIE